MCGSSSMAARRGARASIPARGMSRLVTEDVSRAEAEQRRGRAGRTAPGVCYRLWTRGQEGARPAFPPAEIEVADLSGLALELAQWGGRRFEPSSPRRPEKALAEARALLAALGRAR
jgi:ATP-dependent helicase HrpB